MRKTTLYIPDLLHESLRAASRRSGPPQAEIVREALEAYLEAKGPPALESLDAERYRDIPLGFAHAAVIAGADRHAALHESARNGRVVGEVDVYVRRKHVVDGVALEAAATLGDSIRGSFGWGGSTQNRVVKLVPRDFGADRQQGARA